METLNRPHNTKTYRLDDFICLRCRAEATSASDRVCQLCKALGKSSEPPEKPFSLREFFGIAPARATAPLAP